MQKQSDNLNALIAAPQHHRLLFENTYVRVLDTNIPQVKKPTCIQIVILHLCTL